MTPAPVPPDGEMENPYRPDPSLSLILPNPDDPSAERAWDEGFAAGRAAASPDPPPCRCPDDWRYDDGSVFCPQHQTKPDAPAVSPDERLREALREVVAAFPSPPDREMDDEEIERWYADHGDWFRRLTALIATDRRGTSDE